MSRKLDVQIVTAASILGLKPTGVETLPSVLLSHGLKEVLHSSNTIIDVPTLNHFYTYTRSRQTAILNEVTLRTFSDRLNNAVQKILSSKKFTLILGGDCSILVGIMSALRSKGDHGLFFLDAHADFYQPEKSITGEAADMDLAIVTGRGPESLANIDNKKPYVRDENVIHIGQRDMEETRKYESQEIRSTDIKCFDVDFFHKHRIDDALAKIRAHVSQLKVDGFWIHFDTDVVNDEENPAVDYRLPGGLSLGQCQSILKALVQEYPTLGMSVTIFNPTLDTDGEVAKKLISLFSEVLT